MIERKRIKPIAKLTIEEEGNEDDEELENVDISKLKPKELR